MTIDRWNSQRASRLWHHDRGNDGGLRRTVIALVTFAIALISLFYLEETFSKDMATVE
jgi:hypothetical protein